MKINGKEVNLRFGMLSVELFLSEAEKLSNLSFYSAFGLAKIIHAGMVNFYDVKGLPHPVTFEEIYDHIETGLLNDSELTEVKEAIQQFEQSQALQKKTKQIEEANEELKKKLTGATSELQDMQPG